MRHTVKVRQPRKSDAEQPPGNSESLHVFTRMILNRQLVAQRPSVYDAPAGDTATVRASDQARRRQGRFLSGRLQSF
jgi:hypothetical protein